MAEQMIEVLNATCARWRQLDSLGEREKERKKLQGASRVCGWE